MFRPLILFVPGAIVAVLVAGAAMWASHLHGPLAYFPWMVAVVLAIGIAASSIFGVRPKGDLPHLEDIRAKARSLDEADIDYIKLHAGDDDVFARFVFATVSLALTKPIPELKPRVPMLGVMDSLSLLEFSMMLEEEFDLELRDDEWERANTAPEVVMLLRSNHARRGG